MLLDEVNFEKSNKNSCIILTFLQTDCFEIK